MKTTNLAKGTSLAVLTAVTAGTLLLGVQNAYSDALTPVMMAERNKPTADFSAHLTGLQAVPPVATEAAGNAVITLNAERNQAQVSLRLTSFASPVVGVLIGYGSPGSQGVLIKNLNVTGPGYQAAAMEPASGVTLSNMNVGNLHTTSFNEPEGVTQVSGSRNISSSTPPAEVSPAAGQVTTITVLGNTYVFTEAAAPALPTTSIAWTNSDANSPLNATTVDELIKGRLFLTVLTQAHPNGEIRGQITNANGFNR